MKRSRAVGPRAVIFVDCTGKNIGLVQINLMTFSDKVVRDPPPTSVTFRYLIYINANFRTSPMPSLPQQQIEKARGQYGCPRAS